MNATNISKGPAQPGTSEEKEKDKDRDIAWAGRTLFLAAFTIIGLSPLAAYIACTYVLTY